MVGGGGGVVSPSYQGRAPVGPPLISSGGGGRDGMGGYGDALAMARAPGHC